jgi:hypothetical protein
MKNALLDLNDHLFEQIERLGDENIKGEELEIEFKRAGAICSVASQIISNGRLVMEAVKLADELPGVNKVPMLLGPERCGR